MLIIKFSRALADTFCSSIYFPWEQNLALKPLSHSEQTLYQLIRAQLFKTNDVVSKHIVKASIIKYGIHTNIFAEKMLVQQNYL